MNGRITSLAREQGLGLIEFDDLPEYFIVADWDIEHDDGIDDELEKGRSVIFDPMLTDCAFRATHVNPGPKPVPPVLVHTAASFAMAIVPASVYVWGLGVHWLVAWLVAINLVTFVYYGWDKRVADANRAARFRRFALDKQPRIPENTLHSLALAGGSLGGYFGRRLFPYNTRKAPDESKKSWYESDSNYCCENGNCCCLTEACCRVTGNCCCLTTGSYCCVTNGKYCCKTKRYKFFMRSRVIIGIQLVLILQITVLVIGGLVLGADLPL